MSRILHIPATGYKEKISNSDISLFKFLFVDDKKNGNPNFMQPDFWLPSLLDWTCLLGPEASRNTNRKASRPYIRAQTAQAVKSWQETPQCCRDCQSIQHERENSQLHLERTHLVSWDMALRLLQANTHQTTWQAKRVQGYKAEAAENFWQANAWSWGATSGQIGRLQQKPKRTSGLSILSLKPRAAQRILTGGEDLYNDHDLPERHTRLLVMCQAPQTRARCICTL